MGVPRVCDALVFTEEGQCGPVTKRHRRRIEASGMKVRAPHKDVGGGIEQKRATLRVDRHSALGHEAAVRQDSPRRIIELRMRSRPQVFVGGNPNRLVDRRRV